MQTSNKCVLLLLYPIRQEKTTQISHEDAKAYAYKCKEFHSSDIVILAALSYNVAWSIYAACFGN